MDLRDHIFRQTQMFLYVSRFYRFEWFTGHHFIGSPLAVAGLIVTQSYFWVESWSINTTVRSQFPLSLGEHVLISHRFWGDEPKHHQQCLMKSAKIRSQWRRLGTFCQSFPAMPPVPAKWMEGEPLVRREGMGWTTHGTEFFFSLARTLKWNCGWNLR